MPLESEWFWLNGLIFFSFFLSYKIFSVVSISILVSVFGGSIFIVAEVSSPFYIWGFKKSFCLPLHTARFGSVQFSWWTIRSTGRVSARVCVCVRVRSGAVLNQRCTRTGERERGLSSCPRWREPESLHRPCRLWEVGLSGSWLKCLGLLFVPMRQRACGNAPQIKTLFCFCFYQSYTCTFLCCV